MNNLDICAAQYCSIAGDLNANVNQHLRLMKLAAGQSVDFLLFPELSLTGYEPSLVRELAQEPDAKILQPLRELAERSQMTTVVGLPLYQPNSKNILIVALVFTAAGTQITYTKQYLHPGEDSVFSPGEGGPMLDVKGESVALSICADFTPPKHVRAAACKGALIYATSVLISKNGYSHDSDLLSSYTYKHSIGVLMANYGGPSGGWACAGRSAFWSPGGVQVVSAPGTGNCLVIARRRQGSWHGLTIEYLAL